VASAYKKTGVLYVKVKTPAGWKSMRGVGCDTKLLAAAWGFEKERELREAVRVRTARPAASTLALADLIKWFREPAVAYCRTGGRSARVRHMLEVAGYQSVIDLGAMRNW